jgi:hypothetical protein
MATKSDLRLLDDPDDGRHPGPVHGILSSRRGRLKLGLGRCRSGGPLQGPCAHIDDHGCSRRVELGLDRSRRPHGRQLRFLGLGALGRCARSLSRERGHILDSCREARSSRMRASLAARDAGNGVAKGERVLAPAGPHVRGAKSSEGVSTFRIVLQKSFDEAAARRSRSRACTRTVNES